MVSPGFILAFLLSTLYGAGFHLVFGGRLSRLVTFLLASWIGFILGHWIGFKLGVSALKIGPIYALTASIGSWLSLILAYFFLKGYERQT